MLAFALIGGIIGGSLSAKIFVDRLAYAGKDWATKILLITQEMSTKTNAKKIIEAQEFHLLDQKGKICGTLRSTIAESGETEVKLELLKYAPGSSGIRLSASSEKCAINIGSSKNSLTLNADDSSSNI